MIMSEHGDATIKELLSNLSSSDDIIRIRASHALKAIGEAAVPFLIEALDDPDTMERWEAAKTLAGIDGPNAAPGLVKALENEEFEVRWVAAKGLINMGPMGLKPLLQALMDHGDSVPLREGAHHILHELANEELKPYLASLLAALEGEAPEVEAPIKAWQTLESIDRVERTTRKTNEALLRQLALLQVTMLGQRAVDPGPHERVRRYVKVLNEQRARSILKDLHAFEAINPAAEIHAARG